MRRLEPRCEHYAKQPLSGLHDLMNCFDPYVAW
jgi:hypothetical protein